MRFTDNLFSFILKQDVGWKRALFPPPLLPELSLPNTKITKQHCKTNDHDIVTLLTMPSKKKKKGPKRKKAKADDMKDGGEDKEAVTVAAVDSADAAAEDRRSRARRR